MYLSDDLLLQKWQTEYKKGFSKPLILFTLAEIGRSYAYLLTKKILELTNGEISIAGSNIYPILKNMEKTGLILSKKEQNSQKRFYSLTNDGKDFLISLKMNMKEFIGIIEEMINTHVEMK